MNRRDFIKAIGVAGLVPAAAYAKKTDKPNIIILFIDDLGYGDVGCFGNRRIPTPHMDRLAENGVKCTMSYITNPPCSPSRCSLLTGMYAQKFGKSGMARGLPIPDDHPTLAEFLQEAGYVTGQIGKWDVGTPQQGPQNRGFMEVARYAPSKGGAYNCYREGGEPVYRTELDGEYMIEFVKKHRKKPFFMYFSPFAIHSPVDKTPQSYIDRIKAADGTSYEGAVVAVDDVVGKLVETLKRLGLEKNTLIMLTGDNGANVNKGGSSEPYRGGKLGGNTQFEGWVHTPTIISWPAAIPGGRTYEGLMGTIDFYATAAAAAGGKKLPERCDGVNLLPYMKGEKTGDAHEYICWHNVDPWDSKHRNLRAVRWKNWRLVKHGEEWKLFDLIKDPKETKDLASANKDVVDGMMAHYTAWTATLPPPKQVDKSLPKGVNRKGWGWMINGKGGKPYEPGKKK